MSDDFDGNDDVTEPHPSPAPVVAPVPGAELAGRLRTHLGPRVEERPPPSLIEGLRAVGGLLIATGVLVLAGDRYDADSSGLALFISFLLLAAGVAALLRAPDEFETPAVVLTGVATVAVGFFVVAGNNDPSFSLAGFFVTVLAGALYALPPRRGHTFHLVVTTGALWFAMVALVQGSTGDMFGRSPVSVVNDAGFISVLVGAAYLALGWWLDRSGLRAMATPFHGFGAVALALGMYAAVADWNEVGGGLLATAAGAGICVVGGQTGRRGTTWGGLVVLASGLFALVTGIDPDDAAWFDFLVLTILGGGLLYATIVLAGRGPLAPPSPPAPGEPGPPPSRFTI